MSANIRRADYFYVTVRDVPGAAYRLLAELAGAEVNLLAFSAVPMGPEHTQLTVFPENTTQLARAAEHAALVLTGPNRAFLIQGDDQLGAFVDFHRKLFDAGVNIYASSGVADGRGGYGYVLYVKSEDFDRAAHALGV